jgi:2'-5' RNA ligase
MHAVGKHTVGKQVFADCNHRHVVLPIVSGAPQSKFFCWIQTQFMAKIRTFISVHATQRINANVSRLVERLAASQAGYNWVPEANLHVTLNFVGDLVDREIPEFCKFMTEAIQEHSPFELELSGLGAFPQIGQPRTIWLGVTQGSEELNLLFKTGVEVMQDWGFNKPRHEYVPHMTLGSIKRNGNWNESLLNLLHRHRNHDAGICHVEKVVVNSSTFEGGYPQHAKMATIQLRG